MRDKYRAPYANRSVDKIEQRLSLKEKIFSILSFLRGTKRVTRWAFICMAAIVIYIIVHALVTVSLNTFNVGEQRIEYQSEYGIITKAQAEEILGLSPNTNFAALSVKDLENKLQHHPAISSASVELSGAGILSVRISEHVPLLYVEMKDRAISGKHTRLCLSPDNVIFPYDAALHKKFNELPVWRLCVSDVKRLSPGETIKASISEPIIKLARTANTYSDKTELPSIKTIERPSEHALQWKIVLTLETGTTVEMSALHDIEAQVERLVKMIDHARAINKKLISTNVVPEKYVPAIFE